jgi:hypothetical protein
VATDWTTFFIRNRPANHYFWLANRFYRPINWSQPIAVAFSFEKLNFDRFPPVTGLVNRYQNPAVTWPETVLKTLLIASMAA